jgi:hypothetical protein
MTNADPVELVEWLDETATVKEWELAEAFQGVLITEWANFHPTSLPDGWCVAAIYMDSIHVRKED